MARQSSGELPNRPNGARIGATERSTPNSSSKDHFPPINFTVGDLPSSAHEDSERRGHVFVFQSIGGLLVQFSGLSSITSIHGHENNARIGWCLTRTAWPRWSGVLRWRRRIWGKRRCDGSGRNWRRGLRLHGRKKLYFHRAQTIWAKVERSVRIWFNLVYWYVGDGRASLRTMGYL
jgi:hypothetical protein